MADIYHTFLDDEQEAEYHFRKAHGADKCHTCGGEGGKRHTDYVPYGSTRAAYETWDECTHCDGLGYERVDMYISPSVKPTDSNYPLLYTSLDPNVGRFDVWPIDQHNLMAILHSFAPHAYAAEMRRQGVTP